MKEKEIAYLYAYLVHNQLELEDEIHRFIQQIRYRSVDISDCFELAVLLERYNTFMKVSGDLRELLKTFDKKGLFNYDD